MALACSTGSFQTPIDEALHEVSKLGFAYVDLICIPVFNQIMPAELAADPDGYAGTIAQMVEASGLTPVAVNTAFGNLYQREDPALNRQRLEEVRAVVRLMNRLGVQVASFYPGSAGPARERDWERVLADEVDTLYEIRAIASQAGVTFAVELHAQTPFETVTQSRRLLAAMPELQVAYDASHFVMQGIPLTATEFALERAAHVHLRDAAPGKMQVPYGQGTVDFDWILSALAERGYPGHMAVEYLPARDYDVREQILKTKERVAAQWR